MKDVYISNLHCAHPPGRRKIYLCPPEKLEHLVQEPELTHKILISPWKVYLEMSYHAHLPPCMVVEERQFIWDGKESSNHETRYDRPSRDKGQRKGPIVGQEGPQQSDLLHRRKTPNPTRRLERTVPVWWGRPLQFHLSTTQLKSIHTPNNKPIHRHPLPPNQIISFQIPKCPAIQAIPTTIPPR